VSRDNQHFLMVDPAGDPHTDHFTVVAHWRDTLEH
jgi:hypothetical protein